MNKKLPVGEVFAILLGAIIGWGSFMLPGTKFLPSSGVINTSIGIFLGTMSIVVIEKSYRYMMMQNINEGGEFSFIMMFMGKKHAFVVGWFLFLAYLSLVPLNAMAFPLVVNKLFPELLNFGYLYNIAGDDIYIGEIIVSTLIILFFMYTNLTGIRQTGKVQFIIVLALIICVISVFVGMLFTADFPKFNENYIENYSFDFGQIAQIFAVTPFLFIGFDAIPQLVKDMDVSRKKASFMAVSALLIGMMCYILLNLTTGLAYSPTEAKSLEWALGSAVMEHLGKIGFFLLVIALAAAVSGGINGFMICSSKLISGMAKENILPKNFADINSKGAVKNAIYFVSIIGFFACFFGREVVIWIVDMCSFGAAVTYFYVCLATFLKADNKRIKTEGFCGMLLSVFFALLLILPSSPAALSMPPLIFLGIWSVIGLVFWFRLSKTEKNNSVKNNT